MLPSGTRHLQAVLPKLLLPQRVLPCAWPFAPTLAALARQMEAAGRGCAPQRTPTQPSLSVRAAPGIVTIQTSPVLLPLHATRNTAVNRPVQRQPATHGGPCGCPKQIATR